MIGKSVSHYQILEKLGAGGMGVVWKARDTRLSRIVALKMLPPAYHDNPERRQRFLHEAQAASALSHPNIVTVYDIIAQDGADFIVMEYIAGKALDALIPRKGMRLAGALRIAVQVSGALSAAHRAAIVHRDLKPGNVMVSDTGVVKVLDFGLAKTAEPTSGGADDATRTVSPKTADGLAVGTVGYMSPEQAEAKPVELTGDDAGSNTIPSWSRDGKWIYVASTRSGRSEVWKIPPSRGSAVQLTRNGGGMPKESFDGKFVYFTKGDSIRSIWKVPVDGGEESPVVDTVYGRNFALGSQGTYWIPRLWKAASIRLIMSRSQEANRRPF